MNADTLALACASSPAMSTSSGRPWARTWPKTVLNAFTTCALAGAALAISCAPEVPSGVTSPVASALKVLEMSMMTLPASASPYWATTGTRAGVRHGEDDDVAGRGGAECPGRGAAAERGGQVLGLGRVAADDLDGVAALDRAGGYGAGHAPQADDADAAHGVPAFWSWTGRRDRPAVVNGRVVVPTPSNSMRSNGRFDVISTLPCLA